MTDEDWRVYCGIGVACTARPELPTAPLGRHNQGTGTTEVPSGDHGEANRRIGGLPGQDRLSAPNEVEIVNAVIRQRRPLLVVGPARSGKTSLAYAISGELHLGPVLCWNLTARATQQGLTSAAGKPKLGPICTALLSSERPRVLLINALHRIHLDLPEEIMAVLAAGEFTVDELHPGTERIATHDHGTASIEQGHVRCREFPVVIMTSSADQVFSPSLLRQCMRLRMPRPTAEQLTALVAAQEGSLVGVDVDKLVAEFLTHGDLGTDQLLNAVHLARTVPPDVATAVWHSPRPVQPE